MEVFHVSDFSKGWVVGNFEPSLHRTELFEFGAKFFSKGELEAPHYQKIATEITIVLAGRVRIGKRFFGPGDVCIIPPLEVADFEGIEQGALSVIKFPSNADDKVLLR